MANVPHLRRAMARLLGALSRPRVRVAFGSDLDGDLDTVRVLRSDGPTPDVLHRCDGATWREAVASGLVDDADGNGRWSVSENGRRSLLKSNRPGEALGRVDHKPADPATRTPPRPLVGASAADLAEQQRPSRPLENIAESPLGWLRRRRDRHGATMIGDGQFAAGERLRSDFERGQLAPRVTANWDAIGTGASRGPSGPHAGAELRDATVAARERVNRALTAVGPELGHVLLDVCCHLKGLEQLEREASWPQRSGKIVLQVALSALARHYGIEPDDGATARPMRIGHWGSDDYRPRVDDDRVKSKIL